MQKFETLEEGIGRLPPGEQAAIEAGAEELAHEIEASRIKSGVTVKSLEGKHEKHQ